MFCFFFILHSPVGIFWLASGQNTYWLNHWRNLPNPSPILGTGNTVEFFTYSCRFWWWIDWTDHSLLVVSLDFKIIDHSRWCISCWNANFSRSFPRKLLQTQMWCLLGLCHQNSWCFYNKGIVSWEKQFKILDQRFLNGWRTLFIALQDNVGAILL